MLFVKRCLSILLILFLACCTFAARPHRILKPNDVVRIKCAEEPSLDKDYTVSKDGDIVMPFLGSVQVAGLSDKDAGAKIRDSLIAQRIVPRATLGITVLSSRTDKISYLGAVENTGEMEPTDGMRLSDVAQVAKPTANADLQHVRVVTKADNSFVVNYAAYDGVNNINNPELRPGDNVFFDAVQSSAVVQPVPQSAPANNPSNSIPSSAPQQTSQPVSNPVATPAISGATASAPRQGQDRQNFAPRYVRVMGAVVSPGPVRYRDGMTVFEAISGAGGLLKDSDDARVTVSREQDGQDRTFRVNLAQAEQGMSGGVEVRPNDTIAVPYRGHHGLSKAAKLGAVLLLGLLLLHP